jgi:hypothetical protein
VLHRKNIITISKKYKQTNQMNVTSKNQIFLPNEFTWFIWWTSDKMQILGTKYFEKIVVYRYFFIKKSFLDKKTYTAKFHF